VYFFRVFGSRQVGAKWYLCANYVSVYCVLYIRMISDDLSVKIRVRRVFLSHGVTFLRYDEIWLSKIVKI